MSEFDDETKYAVQWLAGTIEQIKASPLYKKGRQVAVEAVYGCEFCLKSVQGRADMVAKFERIEAISLSEGGNSQSLSMRAIREICSDAKTKWGK